MGVFVLLGGLLLAASTVAVGTVVTAQLERAVTERAGAFASVYVDAYVSHYLSGLDPARPLGREDAQALNRIFRSAPVGREIVSFKLWAPDGTILYSTDPRLIGRRFGRHPGLQDAFSGQVVSAISHLTKTENVSERRSYTRLLETYAPVRVGPSGQVLAVSEFYQRPDALMVELHRVRLRTWLVVSGSMFLTFLSLSGFAHRASSVLLRQGRALQRYVDEVRQLDATVRYAVNSASTRNERMLRRVSADLHDGPAQELSFALLSLDSLQEHVGLADASAATAESERLRSSLAAALQDLRGIAAGLRAPDLTDMSPAQTIERAVRDHCHRYPVGVTMKIELSGGPASLPVRIAAYRIVQESLRNATRHAKGRGLVVSVSEDASWLYLRIKDDGPGFDPALPRGENALGIVGMRDRAQSLGGQFVVLSQPGRGTLVSAALPLTNGVRAEGREEPS